MGVVFRSRRAGAATQRATKGYFRARERFQKPKCVPRDDPCNSRMLRGTESPSIHYRIRKNSPVPLRCRLPWGLRIIPSCEIKKSSHAAGDKRVTGFRLQVPATSTSTVKRQAAPLLSGAESPRIHRIIRRNPPMPLRCCLPKGLRSGRQKDFRALRARASVTSSVGTLLCHSGIASRRRVYGSSLHVQFKKCLRSPLC